MFLLPCSVERNVLYLRSFEKNVKQRNIFFFHGVQKRTENNGTLFFRNKKEETFRRKRTRRSDGKERAPNPENNLAHEDPFWAMAIWVLQTRPPFLAM